MCVCACVYVVLLAVSIVEVFVNNLHGTCTVKFNKSSQLRIS
jgi:hypothetical protein